MFDAAYSTGIPSALASAAVYMESAECFTRGTPDYGPCLSILLQPAGLRSRASVDAVSAIPSEAPGTHRPDTAVVISENQQHQHQQHQQHQHQHQPVKNKSSGVRLQADDEEAVSMLLLAVCAAVVGLLALVLASALVVTGSNQRLSIAGLAGLAGLARHRTDSTTAAADRDDRSHGQRV
jgi:ABC-type nickel/cobalt efflux system permease component RcnA